ncbi:MAG: DUF3604 domain-containing protein [Thermoanaerobaculia bacterium]|nr:DUF3604 domain-containing protein [Thermoanaerobaculia bacterium]
MDCRTCPLFAGVEVGFRWALLFLAVAMVGCDGTRDPGEQEAVTPAGLESAESPGREMRGDIVDALRADLQAERHPADGGGRAWIEPTQNRGEIVQASDLARWTVHFEAGRHGVAQGGTVFLQISPFWGWSTPQAESPAAPGYTEVRGPEGVELDVRTLDQQLLGVTLRSGRLDEGDRLIFRYGAGVAGARADRFAERGERFWIAVDGDGDGVRDLLRDVPRIDVAPGPPARLVAVLPSTRRPGQTARLTLAVLDARGSAWTDFTGTLTLAAEPPGLLDVPSEVLFQGGDRGVRQLSLATRDTGVVRIRVQGRIGATTLDQLTNPLQVAEGALPILWGDLQNHSNVSDGTGLPEDLLRYARDVAALDVVSITDHDHWGLRFLDQDESTWHQILQVTEEYHEPGRFVTLPGFEWTNWLHGHRHVLFFDVADARLLSSIEEEYDHPEELWAALDGLDAMTIAHHTAGGPIAQDWSIRPNPVLEPVTEIVSVHGASEAADAPHPIHRPVAGNFVRDALARGYRFGFLGSSDGHDGHPGLGHLASPSGGLAAIHASAHSRSAVADALRRRSVYATNGPRIVLRAVYGGWRMGSEVPVRDVGSAGRETSSAQDAADRVPGIGAGDLLVQALTSSPLERIDIVRGSVGVSEDSAGGVAMVVACDDRLECSFVVDPGPVVAGEWLYVRVVQRDGGAAWSSPFYFVE